MTSRGASNSPKAWLPGVEDSPTLDGQGGAAPRPLGGRGRRRRRPLRVQLWFSAVEVERSLLGAAAGAPRPLVVVVRIGQRLRVVPASQGYKQWFVAFPRALRAENKVFSVGGLIAHSKGFYVAIPPIREEGSNVANC